MIVNLKTVSEFAFFKEGLYINSNEFISAVCLEVNETKGGVARTRNNGRVISRSNGVVNVSKINTVERAILVNLNGRAELCTSVVDKGIFLLNISAARGNCCKFEVCYEFVIVVKNNTTFVNVYGKVGSGSCRSYND